MLRLSLCLPFVLACLLRAEEKPIPETKVPPCSQGTGQIQGENLICTLTVLRYEPRTETFHPTMERFAVPLKAVKSQVFEPAGQDPTKVVRPIDAMTLSQALRKGTPVLFIRPWAKLETAQLKRLKEGTILVTLPEPSKGQK